LSPDKKRLYVSVWGADEVIVVNTADRKISDHIKVGDNPMNCVYQKAASYYTLPMQMIIQSQVINTQTLKVIETLSAALYPDAPPGSTSNGLALSTDEKTLYIANADNNCLAVFDVSKSGQSKSNGFIPTGWYPTNVKVIGKKIFSNKWKRIFITGKSLWAKSKSAQGRSDLPGRR
jgi:YVTN family beta-propeller protein